MPRPLKPQKVDSVRDTRTGMGLDIMLDRNTNTFFATMAEQTVSDPSADGCKRKAWELLKRLTTLHFQQVIVIQRLSPFCREGAAFVGLEFSRHEIAKSPIQSETPGYQYWIERTFGERPDGAPQDDWRAYTGPAPGYHEHEGTSRHNGDATSAVIPYSPEAWKALELLEAMIIRAREQLNTLMRSPSTMLETTLKQIAERGLKALPPVED